ncbi:MAG: recombinase family protein [Clostridia bacterium]|nr:recombinase family protein [Clostridia bacterium]
MPKVRKIDATVNPITHMPSFENIKRRVAGYARVSTDSDEQFTSYEAQVDYYTNYIKSRADWEFVEVYTDEGISATNTKHRAGFNRMIEDALAGKIDLIVTKSVSRFARNTVDSLVTVRKLKDKGVEVYFEKENIYTLDSKGELLITIMSSLAQEESRSISENVTWGQRKRFADGKVSMPYKCFLGYRRGEDGTPEIVPEEAEIVRRIYSMYLQGKGVGSIANQLTKENILTPAGKSKWATSTVQSILTNEKYKGDALLQKTFTVDFLQKKVKKNEGEVPKYYVEQSHEAIIDPREFELVQQEIVRRTAIGKRYSGQSILSARIICGDCGGFYGQKVWHSTSKYKRTVWQCNEKFRGKECSTPHYDEEEIKERFLKAYNILVNDKEALLEDCRLIQKVLSDTAEVDKKITELFRELEIVSELMQKSIDENAYIAQSQADYNKRYAAHEAKYDELVEKIRSLRDKKEKRNRQYKAIEAFMFEIMEREEPLNIFDAKLWIATIDTVTVYRDGRMVFKFKTGAEIEA